MQSFMTEYVLKRSVPIPKLLYAFDVVLASCVILSFKEHYVNKCLIIVQGASRKESKDTPLLSSSSVV